MMSLVAIFSARRFVSVRHCGRIGSARRCSQINSRGAVLPEFALVLPLMLLFFGGLLELGRLLSQVTWVAQTTYQVAILGAENPNSDLSHERMLQKAQELQIVQQRWLMPNSFQPTSQYIPGDLSDPITANIVKVTIEAELQSFMPKIIPFMLDFKVDVFTPHFVNGAGNIGATNEFPMCDPAVQGSCEPIEDPI